MTKLTNNQAKLLTEAAAAEDGAIASAEQDRAAAASLIKRGFLISIPHKDGPSRLLITEAGRNTIALTEPAAPMLSSAAAEADEDDARPVAAATDKPKGKVATIVEHLRQPEGATLNTLMDITGWQAHSVRGAISGAIKKGLGLTVLSDRTDAGRRYRIPADAEG